MKAEGFPSKNYFLVKGLYRFVMVMKKRTKPPTLNCCRSALLRKTMGKELYNKEKQPTRRSSDISNSNCNIFYDVG
jgi:hypothetical protein